MLITDESQAELLFLLSELSETEKPPQLRGLSDLLGQTLARIATSLSDLEKRKLLYRDAENSWRILAQSETDQALVSALPLLEKRPQGSMGHCLLLLHIGLSLEAADKALTLAETQLFNAPTSAIAACLDIALGALERSKTSGTDSDVQHNFMDCCMRAAALALYLTSRRQRIQLLLRRARDLAELAGNLRDAALVDLIGACIDSNIDHHNTKEVQKRFERGLVAIRSFGDEDILEQAAAYLAFIYFARGEQDEALRHFERGSRHIHRHSRSTFNYFRVLITLYAAGAAVYSGRFRRAIAMLVAGWRQAEMENCPLLAGYYRAHIANYLIYLGFLDEGLEHLNAALSCLDSESPPMYQVWVFRPLAYYHLRFGNVAASYKIMATGLESVQQQGLRRPFFAYPWLLDMLHVYACHGFPPLPGHNLDEELTCAIEGPNDHLRGIAWRIRASQEKEKGGSLRAVLAILEKSMALLSSAHNSLELSKTRLAMAEVLEQLGRKEAAEYERREAEFLLARGSREYGPQLLALTGKSEPAPEEDTPQDINLIREQYREAMRSIGPWETPQEFYAAFVKAACEALQMPRGSLFCVPSSGQAEVLSAYHMSEAESKSEEVTACIEAAERAGMREPVRLEGHFGLMLALPLQVDGSGYLLYLDALHLPVLPLGMHNPALREAMFTFSLTFTTAQRMQKRLEELLKEKQDAEGGRIVRLQPSDDNTVFLQCPGMQDVFSKIKVAAPTDVTLLILGETGVGKELLARHVHSASGRSGPFVPVNIAGTPETLFESEFFGHEKGAFTGAEKQKIGMFELADRGTLFIDEVGEIPSSLQVKLLRVLQDQHFVRVGGIRQCRSNFRLVAATNRDLAKEVREGRFREDLYYRLAVLPLELPPLRERRDDILMLARFFITHFAHRYRRPAPFIGAEQEAMLMHYPWPGNIRELRNVMERAVILSQKKELDLALVGIVHKIPKEETTENNKRSSSFFKELPSMEDLQQRYIKHVLAHTDGKIYGDDGAERILGMKRSTLYSWIKRYKLK